MRDVGVGRSGGLTNWYLMNVADMWACVQDHQTEQHWRHVAGWRKVCDLAGQHLTRLRAYRDGLARAWPPETNAAAKAYVAELDDLIDQVQRTHDAASANQTALSAATQAITSTRTELSKIYEEYARKLQQKRTWETIAADPKAAAGSRASEPPVTDAELERLNVRARGIMYGLSSELQQAQAMLRQPPPPAGLKPGSDKPVLEAIPGSPAPVIPPILPVPIQPAARLEAPRMANPVRPAPTPPPPATGPILGSAGPDLPPSRGTTSGPPSSSPVAPGTGTSGPLPPGSTIIGPESGGIRNGQPNRPANSGPRALPSTAHQKTLPTGLIGGVPAAPSQIAGGSQPRRVNPIGGVIGGSAGTAPAGGAGSRPNGSRGLGPAQGVTPIGGSPHQGWVNPVGSGGSHGRPNRSTREAENGRQLDADNPWQVDQGISPVMRPPDEGPIDPGPAIGLGR